MPQMNKQIDKRLVNCPWESMLAGKSVSSSVYCETLTYQHMAYENKLCPPDLTTQPTNQTSHM